MSLVSIVMYHYVRDLGMSRYPGIKGLDFALFRQQIEFLNANFNVVTMEEVLAARNESYNLPQNAALLTFDDGYTDHFTNVLPVLKEYGMQGSFFIPGKTFCENIVLDANKVHFILASGGIRNILADLYKQMDHYRGAEYPIEPNEELFCKYAGEDRFDTPEVVFVKRMLQTVLPEDLRNKIASNIFEKYVGLSEEKFGRELYMNRWQIKCMKQCGMHIGLHGYDHYWLGNLQKPDMLADLDRALDAMGEFIDPNAWVMNYPYGSYNQDVVEAVQSRGCALGLTTEVRVADMQKDGRYTMPRLDTNDFPPKSEYYKDRLEKAAHG